jgi:hypothetical protein
MTTDRENAPAPGRRWPLAVAIGASVVAVAALAFAAGVVAANKSDNEIHATSEAAASVTTTTTATTTSSTTAPPPPPPPTTTTVTPTTFPPTTATTEPYEPAVVPGAQEWSDEYARLRAALGATEIDGLSDDPCGPILAVVEEWSGALSNPPTPDLATAYQALLAQQRYVYGRCMQLGLNMAEIEAMRLREMHNTVVSAIYATGATYNGR